MISAATPALAQEKGGGPHKIRISPYDPQKHVWWGTYGMQPGQFWEPHQISIDGEGNLYIADSFGGRTQKYSPSKAGDRTKWLVPVK